MKVITPRLKDTIIHNFVGGIAWGLGVTIGLAFVGYLLSVTVTYLGGVPLVGNWLANIVKETLLALENK